MSSKLNHHCCCGFWIKTAASMKSGFYESFQFVFKYLLKKKRSIFSIFQLWARGDESIFFNPSNFQHAYIWQAVLYVSLFETQKKKKKTTSQLSLVCICFILLAQNWTVFPWVPASFSEQGEQVWCTCRYISIAIFMADITNQLRHSYWAELVLSNPLNMIS